MLPQGVFFPASWAEPPGPFRAQIQKRSEDALSIPCNPLTAWQKVAINFADSWVCVTQSRYQKMTMALATVNITGILMLDPLVAGLQISLVSSGFGPSRFWNCERKWEKPCWQVSFAWAHSKVSMVRAHLPDEVILISRCIEVRLIFRCRCIQHHVLLEVVEGLHHGCDWRAPSASTSNLTVQDFCSVLDLKIRR